MTQTYQSNYKSYLTQSLSASGTTAYLQTVPTVTEGRLLLSNGNIKEWVSFTGVSGSTVTGLTRGLSQTADPATAGTGLEWGAGTQVILVAMHDQLVDKNEDQVFLGAISAPDVTFTGTTTGGLKVKSLTTTQRDALSSPGNGTVIYNSTAGEFQIRQGGAWSTMASGSTQPNASTTVAGKVEEATSAESIAGTVVGGTGADLFVTPLDIAKNTQSGTFIYGTDVGGDDTYVVALTPTLAAYTTGQTLFFKPSTTNTGACTVDFGPGVKNIKTKDGNDPQSGVIRANMIVELFYDGTNFVLATEDFSTTSNKGIAQLATDTKAEAGTDTTDPVVSSQLDKYSVSTSLRSDWYTVYYGDQEMKSMTGGTDLAGAYYFSNNSATIAAGAAQYTPSGFKGSGSTTILTYALTKDFRIKWVQKYDSNNDIQGIGLALAAATIYTAHTDITNGTIRFVNNAGTLYAHNANGSAATSTDITSGITMTNWNTYEIVVNPGTDIKFYVNGTLKATHTTNLPTTGTPLLFSGVSNNANTRLIAMTPFTISYEL